MCHALGKPKSTAIVIALVEWLLDCARGLQVSLLVVVTNVRWCLYLLSTESDRYEPAPRTVHQTVVIGGNLTVHVGWGDEGITSSTR